MINIQLQTNSTSGRSTPKIKILSGEDPIILTIPDGINLLNFDIEDCGILIFDFFNKVQNDTIIDSNNNIVKDSTFKITKIWYDHILLEPWFLSTAVYRPRYFDGFLKQFPNSPEIVLCPFQFNFPGMISWQWDGNFWDWYFNERNKREIINFIDKDPDRVWKFRGSLDPCIELVAGLKNLCNI